MSESRRGVAFGAAAYLLWGLFPLYWTLLDQAGAIEILAHRIVWSLAFVLVLLVVRRQWTWVRDLAASPRALGLLLSAAVLVAGNWGLYIWGVNHGHVVETSLGYFVSPLVTVLLGVLVLHEQLRGLQWLAVGIASLAVIVLTVDLGRPPWIALGLAFSFAGYGLAKNKVGASFAAVESLAVETVLLFLPALAWLLLLGAGGDAAFGQHGPVLDLLLVAGGVVTAIPLLLFAGAARRIPLTVIGLLQYVTPVLQFLIGVFVFREPMPAPRLAGFALVWAALVLFSYDGLTHRRRSLRRAAEAIV